MGNAEKCLTGPGLRRRSGRTGGGCGAGLATLGVGLALGRRRDARYVIADTLVVVVHGHREHLFGPVLADHVPVQVLVNLSQSNQTPSQSKIPFFHSLHDYLLDYLLD